MGALGNTLYQRQAGEKAMATDEKHPNFHRWSVEHILEYQRRLFHEDLVGTQMPLGFHLFCL